jgi:hypothetical protein
MQWEEVSISCWQGQVVGDSFLRIFSTQRHVVRCMGYVQLLQTTSTSWLLVSHGSWPSATGSGEMMFYSRPHSPKALAPRHQRRKLCRTTNRVVGRRMSVQCLILLSCVKGSSVWHSLLYSVKFSFVMFEEDIRGIVLLQTSRRGLGF